MVNNLKGAKELLEKYKSITLEQLDSIYKRHPQWKGKKVMFDITEFGSMYCPLCISATHVCKKCVYSFRMINEWDIPCMDIIYKEMVKATSAIELFNALQKRISYLIHVIEWYENSN